MSFTWKIPAQRILSTGLDIDELVTPEWLSKLIDEPTSQFRWQALKEAQVHIELMPEADMIHVTGQTQVITECPCVRCLKEVVFQLPIQFNVRLLARPAVVKEEDGMKWDADDDAVVSEEEVAIAYYDDGIIDIAALIREQFFLDLPAYPVCDHPLAAQPHVCAFHEKSLLGDNPVMDNRWAPLAAWRKTL